MKEELPPGLQARHDRIKNSVSKILDRIAAESDPAMVRMAYNGIQLSMPNEMRVFDQLCVLALLCADVKQQLQMPSVILGPLLMELSDQLDALCEREEVPSGSLSNTTN